MTISEAWGNVYGRLFRYAAQNGSTAEDIEATTVIFFATMGIKPEEKQVLSLSFDLPEDTRK